MCGIYLTNMPRERQEIDKKLSSIRFRGPDNTSILYVRDIIMGHLRLSILDLDDRSNQPMRRDGMYIVFNGEIYNFLSLKNELLKLGYDFETTSDTETLLLGFQHWGSEVLQRLNGMFSFAIYDSLKEKIFCARDRLGVKPFYYYLKNSQFEICSQLRPLISPESKISEEAISIYLDCGYVPTPYSIIEDVYKLPPGNFMEIDLKKGSMNITEYWNLKPVEVRDISYEEAKTELHELLMDAVKIRLRSDVPLGSFLSGGIDSALVSSIASKLCVDPINTFTIKFDDPKYDESKVAGEFAKIINSNHIQTTCGPNDVLRMLPKLIEVYDEPFADSSALPSLLLNSVFKQYGTVALSGDGGDESFFGYTNFDRVYRFGKIEMIPYIIRKLLSKVKWYKFFGKSFITVGNILKIKSSYDLSRTLFIGYDGIKKIRNIKWFKENYDGYKHWSRDVLQRTADLNIKLWLENDSNVKVDRASMAYAVEVRSPFLDYRIIEFARNLPINYRYQPGKKKKYCEIF